MLAAVAAEAAAAAASRSGIMIGGYDDERLTVTAHVWTRAAVAGGDEGAAQL